MKHSRIRLIPALVIALSLAAVALAGAGFTAYAAQDALPGDALYAVKTGMEQTRLALTRGSINRAKLELQLADRRLDELTRLAEQSRYAEMHTLMAQLQAHTSRATGALSEIPAAQADPQSQRVKAMIAGAIAKQAMVVNGLSAGMPQADLATLQKAMASPAASQAGAASPMVVSISPSSGSHSYGMVESISDTAWVIDGASYAITTTTKIEDVIVVGDMVEFDAFIDAAGVSTLLKVELAGDDSNTNGNANSNENGNTNDNGNSNENGNSNGNGNSNEDPDDDHEMYGTVEAISATAWTIAGVTYTVDANTRIEGSIQVGDFVEFHVATAVDGSQVITKIELEDDDESNTNGNSNEDDDDDDDHGNTNGNSNDDDDDDDDHGNSNDNDDDDDDHGNNNGNSNDDDDDDDDDGGGGGNDNEDHDD